MVALYWISHTPISHCEFVIVSNPSNFAIFLVFLPLCSCVDSQVPYWYSVTCPQLCRFHSHGELCLSFILYLHVMPPGMQCCHYLAVSWPYSLPLEKLSWPYWSHVMHEFYIKSRMMVPHCASLRILVILVIVLNLSNFGLTFSSHFFTLLWIFRYWLGLLWYCHGCLQSCCLHFHGELCVIIVITASPHWIWLYNCVEKHTQHIILRKGQATTALEYILVAHAELASEAGERGWVSTKWA